MNTKWSIRMSAWIVVAALGLDGSVARAEVPDELRVPLAGVEIAELFPGLADNPDVRVWALKGSALDPNAVEVPNAVFGDPVSLGSAPINYTTIQGSVFVPNHDAFVGGDAGAWGLFCESGGNRFASAQAELPDGASLIGFRAWNEDVVTDSAVATSMFEVCQHVAAPGAVDVTFLGNVSSPTISVSTTATTFSEPVTLDTTSCFYPVLAEFGDGATICGSGLVLNKVRLAWSRQIGQAPSSPTFDDVPTSHLFYQPIEALARSGVTAGCDGDNFCPNASLTRAQMAAFLAKALGLGWELPGLP